MKISVNWLKEYLNLNEINDSELFDLISFHISEIEEFTKLVKVNNLTIGEVIECVIHPDSNHLHICQVKLANEITQIVCGAPNIGIGEKVIVALPGANFSDFTIKKSVIRGIESNGMICSLQELGIQEKFIPAEFKDGIFILDDNAPIGSDPLKYLGLDDKVIDLDLTSNRSDLLSIEGFAFDLGAILHQKVKTINPKLIETNELNPISIEVLTDKCPIYHTRVIKNVIIKDSPYWMKSRLIASGIRPINNVVDITNYVLMELGQPLHSFDAEKLGNKIVVRKALDNEELITLDGIKRSLSIDDIVITDGKNPLCVAGVMGGISTEVTALTKDIVLEAAYFDPISIRKTSSKLGLKSDSSIRFERKIDYNRITRALDYAAFLIHELASGEVMSGINSIILKKFSEKTVEITIDDINKVLGTELKNPVIEAIFDDLAYSYEKTNEKYLIKILSRRMDLEASKQDIIEDVVRMYGYDNIPTINSKTSDNGSLTNEQKQIRNMRHILSDMGFNETVTYSLVAEKDLYNFTQIKKEPIKLLMPMTEDRSVMRQSLLNGLLGVISYNRARKMEDLAIFEIGNVYYLGGETLMLSGAISGVFESNKWRGIKEEADFYLLKGILDSISKRFNVSFEYEATIINDNFHPGRCANIKINGAVIGFITGLHPRFATTNDLGNNTYLFEISLSSIINNVSNFKYCSINKFPTITRDLAIVVKKDVIAGDLINIIKQTAKKNLSDISIFDVYEGENVESDEKSLAIKMIFEDTTKTMETADVDKIVKSILNRLDFNFKAKLR